jgi:hypothetical protein
VGHTVGQRSWKMVFFRVTGVAVMEKCFDAWGWGNTVSVLVFRRQRMAVYEGQRLASTGSRWDRR